MKSFRFALFSAVVLGALGAGAPAQDLSSSSEVAASPAAAEAVSVSSFSVVLSSAAAHKRRRKKPPVAPAAPAAPAQGSSTPRAVQKSKAGISGFHLIWWGLAALAAVLGVGVWSLSERSAMGKKSDMPREEGNDAPAVGSVIGGRLILDALLERDGGVYDARDLQDKPLVVVRLKPKFSLPREREIFLSNARAAAALNHPGIVPVEGVYEQGSSLYLALKPFRGQTLRRLLDKLPRRRITADQGAAIAKAAAEALDYAHGCEVVHGALSPSVIMVDKDSVQLKDFCVLSGSQDPAYAAPEEKKTGKAADIYAFAVCLYEMLTGEPPFPSGEEGLSAKKEGRLKAPSEKHQGLPPAADEFFARALNPDPAARFPNAAETAGAFCALFGKTKGA